MYAGASIVIFDLEAQHQKAEQYSDNGTTASSAAADSGFPRKQYPSPSNIYYFEE